MILRNGWKVFPAVLLLAVGLFVTACGSTSNAKSAATAAPAVMQGLVLTTDTVQGSKNVPDNQKADHSCVLSSRYPRNSQIVFRSKIVDPATGDLMDDQALASVQVQLANGQKIDMKYGAHPKNPPNEYFWTGSWVVPKDAPTGSLNYTIVATAKDGRTGQYKPIVSATSLPTITDEVYADAPTPAATPTPKP